MKLPPRRGPGRKHVARVAAEEGGALRFAGLDKAITGTAQAWDTSGNRFSKLVYSGERIVKAFMRKGMTEEEAREFVDYNVEGAYVGPGTPIVVWPYELD